MKVASKYVVLLMLAGLVAALFFQASTTAKTVRVSSADKGAESVVPEAVFTNASPITIPALGNASPYPSTINVTGLSGTITSVKVTFNGFNHTFPDDLGIVVVGPTGAALLVQDGAGEAPVPSVTYTIADSGATPLPDVATWGPGTYKPAAYFTGDSFPSPGPLLAYSHPGPAGGNTATFASTFNGTAPNGNWNLFIVDFVGGDAGGLSGGWSIEITTNAATAPPQHVVDFNGDGKTDWAVVRNTGGGPSGQITWFVQNNGVAGSSGVQWGIASDQFVPADFDGDLKTDWAVWRPGPGTSSTIYILQSSTLTARIENFGLIGDQSDVAEDYDGDGKDDVAVYRPGAAPGDPSTWFFKGSFNNPSGNITYVPWGQNGDFPAPGDYDGDGKADFVIQRNNGGGQAKFWMSQTTAGLSQVVFGTPTDVIVPGDYDGDGKTDLATVRGSAGQILWSIRGSSGGGGFTQAVWGNSATDFPAMGDYDGDGKTDLAIWRPNADPTQNLFWVLNSSNSAVQQFEWGQNGDYPIANVNTH